MTTTAPQTHGPAEVIEHLRQALIAEAAAANAQYPQYAGHWDSYRVAEVTRNVGKPSRRAFRAGELVLVASSTYTERVAPKRGMVPYEQWPLVEFATAYSRSNGIDTAVRATDIREVRADA
jgi:hypothetical protein